LGIRKFFRRKKTGYEERKGEEVVSEGRKKGRNWNRYIKRREGKKRKRKERKEGQKEMVGKGMESKEDRKKGKREQKEKRSRKVACIKLHCENCHRDKSKCICTICFHFLGSNSTC
jgi:hypothetical protein